MRFCTQVPFGFRIRGGLGVILSFRPYNPSFLLILVLNWSPHTWSPGAAVSLILSVTFSAFSVVRPLKPTFTAAMSEALPLPPSKNFPSDLYSALSLRVLSVSASPVPPRFALAREHKGTAFIFGKQTEIYRLD